MKNNLKELQIELLDLFTIDGLKEHSLNVAENFEFMSDKYIVGLCHDLVEDKEISEEDLKQLLSKYGKEYLIHSILVVTRNSLETYKEYIYRVKNSNDEVAISVKLVDMNNNYSRKETLTPKLAKRYENAIKILTTDKTTAIKNVLNELTELDSSFYNTQYSVDLSQVKNVHDLKKFLDSVQKYTDKERYYVSNHFERTVVDPGLRLSCGVAIDEVEQLSTFLNPEDYNFISDFIYDIEDGHLVLYMLVVHLRKGATRIFKLSKIEEEDIEPLMVVIKRNLQQVYYNLMDKRNDLIVDFAIEQENRISTFEQLSAKLNELEKEYVEWFDADANQAKSKMESLPNEYKELLYLNSNYTGWHSGGDALKPYERYKYTLTAQEFYKLMTKKDLGYKKIIAHYFSLSSKTINEQFEIEVSWDVLVVNFADNKIAFGQSVEIKSLEDLQLVKELLNINEKLLTNSAIKLN